MAQGAAEAHWAGLGGFRREILPNAIVIVHLGVRTLSGSGILELKIKIII